MLWFSIEFSGYGANIVSPLSLHSLNGGSTLNLPPRLSSSS